MSKRKMLEVSECWHEQIKELSQKHDMQMVKLTDLLIKEGIRTMEKVLEKISTKPEVKNC